jgi:hypothetical protein
MGPPGREAPEQHRIAAEERLPQGLPIAVPELGVRVPPAERSGDEPCVHDGEGEAEPDDAVRPRQQQVADVIVVAVEDPADGVRGAQRRDLAPELLAGEALPAGTCMEHGIELDERDVEPGRQEATDGRLPRARRAVDDHAASEVDRAHNAAFYQAIPGAAWRVDDGTRASGHPASEYPLPSN